MYAAPAPSWETRALESDRRFEELSRKKVRRRTYRASLSTTILYSNMEHHAPIAQNTEIGHQLVSTVVPSPQRSRLQLFYGQARDSFRAMDPKAIKLVLAMIALIGSRAVDQVLSYRMTDMFSSYTWLLGAIILPLAYNVILWPIVLYKMYVSKTITMKERMFPQLGIAIMAMFDAASSIVGTWPVPYLPSSMTNALSNAVLPFTLLFSIVFLGRKYLATHYLGAMLMVTGMTIRLLPSILNPGPKDHLIAGYVWVPILILSQIPSAASNVYKEGGLQNFESNVWHVNAFVGLYQFLFGILTIPTVFIPWPQPAEVIPPAEIGTYLKNGATCFFGRSNILEGSSDDCESVIYIFLGYILFNVAFNQLMLYVFKEGSSLLAVIASALRLPIVDGLLLIPFISGKAQQSSLSLFDWSSLFLLIAGMISYNLYPEITVEKNVKQLYPEADTSEAEQHLLPRFQEETSHS